MVRTFVRLALCASVLFVAACASHTEIPFDRAGFSDIKRIGVVTPIVPANSTVVLASTIGQHFGLLGKLADLNLEQNRVTTMDAMLGAQKFDPKAELVRALDASLQRRGYQVTDIPAVRHDVDFITDFSFARQQPVDAYLDVVVSNYGFVAAGISSSSPYRPAFYLQCRLILARDPSKVLMFETVLYNPFNTPPDAINLSPSDGDAFVDFDTLTADPARSTRALTKAIDQSAETVAKVLD